MNSCNDDEFLPGNPSMEIKAENADALFGDSLPFTIKASDVDVPLSTLKAQLFYGEEQVSETVIRTKTSGSDYTGKIYIPYYANIPNGKATLKYILQNIHFTTTEQETELTLARPDFPYLTLVDEEGQEYRMDRQSMYHYSVSGDFSQKMKVYIKTPKVGEHGNELTFGWEDNTIAVGSTTSIPFSNTEPGNYTIQFNTFNYEASPFAKLLLNGKEMELVENDVYAVKLSLKQNDILTFEGVPAYDEWWIDPDFFEKQEDGTLKFLPIDGSYQITANGKRQYFSVIALKDGEAAKLQDDGTGAIWAIGNGIGKPSVSLYEVGWTPENGLCMPQLTAKKYQLTFTAGVTMKTSDIDFKFFHINKWDNGEFKGDAISTTSDLVEITESGNLKLQEGQKFERGGVYKFTVDVTKGNTKAVLTVEKVGQVDLPRPDITINGMKLEEGSSDMYQLQMSLTQNQTLEIGGIEDLNDWYVDPDYLVKTGDNHLKFLPVAGSYRVMVNATRKYFAVVRMNGNSEAGLDADGQLRCDTGRRRLNECRRTARQSQIVGTGGHRIGHGLDDRRRVELLHPRTRQRHQRRIAFGTASSPQPSPAQRIQYGTAAAAQQTQRQLFDQLLRHPPSEPLVDIVRRHRSGIGDRRRSHPQFADILPVKESRERMIRPYPTGDRADRRDTDAVVETVAALAALHRLGHRAVHLAAQLAEQRRHACRMVRHFLDGSASSTSRPNSKSGSVARVSSSVPQ